MRLDTQNNKVIEIEEVKFHSKIDPGKIEVENFNIDSTEAVKLATDYIIRISWTDESKMDSKGYFTSGWLSRNVSGTSKSSGKDRR